MTEKQEEKGNNPQDKSDLVALLLVLVHHFSWAAASVDVNSVNGLFEELLHSNFNGIAANASHWARGIDFSVVILTPWGVDFFRVPLSKGETSLLILHLLRHNVHLGTSNILKLYSHVTDLVTQLWCPLMVVLLHSSVQISIIHVDHVEPSLRVQECSRVLNDELAHFIEILSFPVIPHFKLATRHQVLSKVNCWVVEGLGLARPHRWVLNAWAFFRMMEATLVNHIIFPFLGVFIGCVIVIFVLGLDPLENLYFSLDLDSIIFDNSKSWV